MHTHWRFAAVNNLLSDAEGGGGEQLALGRGGVAVNNLILDAEGRR